MLFFVNCDWGTTHFRLRAVRTEGVKIVAEFRSDDGAARLAEATWGLSRADRFRTTLENGLRQLSAQLAESLDRAPVLISGMASSSIGWQALPYARLPFALDATGLVWQELAPLSGDGLDHRVILVSGACSADDVMRGEETQALGLFELAVASGFRDRSLVIMPGTHSKHLNVLAGQIQGFRTFMTGELFDVLGKHSILRHSIGREEAQGALKTGESVAAFQAGIDEGAKLSLSSALFRTRTRQLLNNTSEQSNRAFLSGLLIGSELAYLRDAEFSSQRLLLCAAASLAEYYATALATLGLSKSLTIIEPHHLDRLSALGHAVLLRKLSEF